MQQDKVQLLEEQDFEPTKAPSPGLDMSGAPTPQALSAQLNGPPSISQRMSALESGAPGPAPAPGITPLNTNSMRDLLPVPPASAPAAPSTAPGVNTAPVVTSPVLGSVSPQGTVAHQIRELLSEDSPYLQQARDRGRAAAASRGLQNTTMAGVAGESAARDAALPIAQQDAAAHFQQGMANQSAQNQFGLNQQQIEGNRQLQAEASAQRMVEAALQGDIQSRQMLEKAGYDFQLSVQENVNRLREIAAQGDVNARLALQQFGFQTDLLTQEGRQKLEQLVAQGDQSARLALLDYEHRSLLLDKEAGINLTLEDKRFQNQQQLIVTEYAQRLGLSQQEQTQMIERMNLQHTHTLAQIAAQAQATTNAEYGPRLQSQYLAAVSERMNAGSNEIAQIYQTQGLSSAQQQSAVQQARVRMEQDLASIGRYYAQSPLWDHGWGANPGPAPGYGGGVVPGGGTPGPIMTTQPVAPRPVGGSGGGPRTQLMRDLLE